MDRRSFLGMTGAGLTLPALGVATTSCDDGSSIELSLSGLFAMELWDPSSPPSPGQEPKRFTKLAFVDGEKTLGVAHAAMLIAHFEDCVMPGQVGFPSSNESHRPAQILRVSNSVFGMWSLTDYALWIDLGEKGKEERYPTDDHGDFAFPVTQDPIAQGPKPPDADAGWAGRQWFLDMGEILGTRPDELNSSLISARILLRHGQAAGVAPMTQCERRRKYYFDKKEDARAVAAEIKVRHPANPAQQYTDFRVARLSPDSNRAPDTATDGAIIRLRTSPGRTTRVAIVNVPLFAASSPAALMDGASPQKCEHDHFQAYFQLVHKEPKCLQVVEETGENRVKCPERGSYRNPSEAGCTPCIIKRA